MDETPTTASDSIPTAPQNSPNETRRSLSRQGSWIPRPAYVAMTFVLILTIGWGAFSIIGRKLRSDEEAELADLECFDAEPRFQETPERRLKNGVDTTPTPSSASNPSWERRSPWSVPSDPGSIELLTPTHQAEFQPTIPERTSLAGSVISQSRSGAWLIGTIESDDASELIAIPPRVSQASVKGRLFQ